MNSDMEEGVWLEQFAGERCLICPKCNRNCRLFTSSSEKNPGRRYYKCVFNHALFFKWADQVQPHDLIQVPYCGGCTAGICRVQRVITGPNKNRILFTCRVKEGEGSCGYRVWQDELQMLEERPNLIQARTADCNESSGTVTVMLEDTKKNDEGSDNVSSLIEPSDDLLCREVTSQMMDPEVPSRMRDHEVILKPHFLNEPETLSRVKCVEDKCNVTSRRPHKRSRYGDIIDAIRTVTVMLEDTKKNDEGSDNVSPLIDPSDDLLCREVTSQMMDPEVPSRMRDYEVILKPHFLNEPETLSRVKCVEDKCNVTSRRPHKRSHYGDIIDAIRQNLSTELNGWWGRLVFHPMPCLIPSALDPSISCVSYSIESTYVAENISINSSRSINSTTNSWGVESYNELSFNPIQHHSPSDSTYVVREKILVNSSDASNHRLGDESYRRPFVVHGISSPVLSGDHPLSKTGTHSIMSKSISNAFNQAAERLQSDLLALLETMDVKDHEAMRHAAETTFAALEILGFDHEDLKKRVKELIRCASSLVEIEQSMPENSSHQRLAEHCLNERVRLDEMKSVHDKAVEAVAKNKKHLQVMQEEISSTMDWLFHVEAEVSCCEVELNQLELELEEIAKEKEALEVKYTMASKEVEESRKILEQKEAEQNAAKAAFERARALLRG